MNIIASCIKCGSEVELVCDGPDEENAALAEAVCADRERTLENNAAGTDKIHRPGGGFSTGPAL
jgi:hypothetical protein